MGVGNPDQSSGDGPAILLFALVALIFAIAGSCKVLDHYRPGWDGGAPPPPAPRNRPNTCNDH